MYAAHVVINVVVTAYSMWYNKYGMVNQHCFVKFTVYLFYLFVIITVNIICSVMLWIIVLYRFTRRNRL